jgi:hypothetical protein
MAEGESDVPFLLVIAVGLFVGALIGAMANVTPFQIVVFCAMLVDVAVWRQTHFSLFPFFILFGLFIGGIFGVLSNSIPWGVPIFFGIQMGAMVWRGSGTLGSSGGISLVTIPLYTILSIGLFYNNTYADFCILNGADVCNEPANWVKGFPTIWAGCVSTCSLTPFSILGSSIFSSFINSAATGDYVGLITGFFTGTQSIFGGGFFQLISTILVLAAGIVLVMIGLGIGFSAQLLASGFGITINEAGTRFAQSFGIGLIIWSVVFGAFGGWFSVFGSGLTWGGVFSTTMVILFATASFYGFYIQGKQTTGGT